MKPRFTFMSAPGRCEYLPDRLSETQYEVVGDLTSGEYMERLDQGWRRFGHTLFRPACRSCRMCQSLRVPVSTFRPNQSQRRAWKANRDAITITVGPPSASAAKRDLFRKFKRHGHATKGWPAPDGDDDLAPFMANPVPTQEWCYYVADRLIGVGYVDELPDGLSAIYFVYDPDERHRSLGTFNVLALLAVARNRGLPYVHLGYYVEGCRSLEYKARFRPNEILLPDRTWTPFLDR